MIFYFSATGNSKAVAKRISQKTGEPLISIAESVKKGDYSFTLKENETLGIVSPTYFWGIPNIVKTFLENVKFNIDESNYVFFVATYGMLTGQIGKAVDSAIEKNGLKINGYFSVKTVDTYVPIFDVTNKAKIEETLKKANEKADSIAEQILKNACGDYIKDKVPLMFVKPYINIYEKKRNTKFFKFLGNCINCKVCEKFCPENAIKLQDGKPTFIKSKCSLCLGCLHRCPEGAIHYGKKNKHGQFINEEGK